MKFRAVLFIFAVVLVLSGCTNGGEAGSKLTLDDVITAIRTEGPSVVPLSRDGKSYALNNVKPSFFTIANANEDVVKPEEIKVYIFESETAMMEATKNFVFAEETTPRESYKQKNAFVVYYAYGGKIEKFGDTIESAIKKL
ncbi:hypothetical protein [Paenibacillus sp. BK720]|uniref:hypothetical protein n=1 Tax=Paenibacillus sp. BK720 TaxID=2587092 RepID=UPI0014210167|nr:hypothetical protein [Paenibacillus sp. BK720]NIK70251.1 hypothetical protein [Paenibacillus sp. BK720]